MRKITLTFKGDVRVMFFGKEGWDMSNLKKVPECNHAFIGFTRIESVECDDLAINVDVYWCMRRYLEGVHSSRFESAGEYLLSFDDFDNVEIPVTFEIDNDAIGDFTLLLMKDNTHFEGKEEFCIPYIMEYMDNENVQTLVGDYDKEIVGDIISKCDLYKDCADKLFSRNDVPKNGMCVKREKIPCMEMCAGGKSEVVPCSVAQEVKRLINKFRLEVTDLKVIKPYYMDDWQYQDYYEFDLFVKPAKATHTRKYSNAHDRMCKKLSERYGWEIIIIDD